eukprot:gene16077-biopygen10136
MAPAVLSPRDEIGSSGSEARGSSTRRGLGNRKPGSSGRRGVPKWFDERNERSQQRARARAANGARSGPRSRARCPKAKAVDVARPSDHVKPAAGVPIRARWASQDALIAPLRLGIGRAASGRARRSRAEGAGARLAGPAERRKGERAEGRGGRRDARALWPARRRRGWRGAGRIGKTTGGGMEGEWKGNGGTAAAPPPRHPRCPGRRRSRWRQPQIWRRQRRPRRRRLLCNATGPLFGKPARAGGTAGKPRPQRLWQPLRTPATAQRGADLSMKT